MASFRRSLRVAGVLSALLSPMAASPVSNRETTERNIGLGLGQLLGDLGLGLGLGLGEILDFCVAPLVEEVVPVITLTYTVITDEAVHIIKDGEKLLTIDKPATVCITSTQSKTTTYPCSTETTYISTFADSKGKETHATCRWNPHPPRNCIGSSWTPTISKPHTTTITITSTTIVPCSTTTTTSSSSSSCTTPPHTTTKKTTTPYHTTSKATSTKSTSSAPTVTETITATRTVTDTVTNALSCPSS
ncbi:hypothetical protein F5884DRAFT_756246 [Xylogone sp. PMI_703]|nr:hypothetical protein F5884DRAFT_756246 [Xylogone sp. PMI_703]